MIKRNWQFGNSSILAKYIGSPVINKELVYISAGDINNATLYAIDVQTGKEQWFYTSNSSDYDSFISPTVSKDSVYVISIRGDLVSLDALTGNLNWKIEVETSILPGSLTSSPIIVNGVIYVGSNNGYLYSFDVNTGGKLGEIQIIDNSVANTSVINNSVVNTPVYANDERTICVELSNSSVYAIDIKTQEVRWMYPNEKSNLSFDGYPAIYKGIVYSGGNRTNFVALDLESGNQIWNFEPTLAQAFTSSAVADNLVCFGNNNGAVWGAKYDTGQILWSYETVTTWKNIGFGWLFSPQINNHRVLCGGRGYLRLLELQTGKEIWKYEAPYSEKLLFEPKNLIFEVANRIGKALLDNPFSIFYSPSISNDSIYVVAKNGSYKRFLSLTVKGS